MIAISHTQILNLNLISHSRFFVNIDDLTEKCKNVSPRTLSFFHLIERRSKPRYKALHPSYRLFTSRMPTKSGSKTIDRSSLGIASPSNQAGLASVASRHAGLCINSIDVDRNWRRTITTTRPRGSSSSSWSSFTEVDLVSRSRNRLFHPGGIRRERSFCTRRRQRYQRLGIARSARA